MSFSIIYARIRSYDVICRARLDGSMSPESIASALVVVVVVCSEPVPKSRPVPVLFSVWSRADFHNTHTPLLSSTYFAGRYQDMGNSRVKDKCISSLGLDPPWPKLSDA